MNESTDRYKVVSKPALQVISDRRLFGLVLASLSTSLFDNPPENRDVNFFKIMALMHIFTPPQPGRPALQDVRHSLRLPNQNTL